MDLRNANGSLAVATCYSSLKIQYCRGVRSPTAQLNSPSGMDVTMRRCTNTDCDSLGCSAFLTTVSPTPSCTARVAVAPTVFFKLCLD